MTAPLAQDCSTNFQTSTSPDPEYRVCSRCVMDTTDPDISFEDGICNHCRDFEFKKSVRLAVGDAAKAQLEQVVARIKLAGRGKDYDCIAGVSGGVDSTYVVYLAKQLGLRPLAVHFDNGWNTELAVSNIEKVLKTLNVDLQTYVVDWEEFKDLQRSFLLASTPDAEVPTDHAIYALLFHTARKVGVQYVLNGMNFASEGISIPGWAYGHSDWKYIRSVHKKFGHVPLRSFPHYSLLTLFHSLAIRRLKFVSLLNYIKYDKTDAVRLLEQELGWRAYSGKHHESIYTRFLQSYILPRKFKIDKRKAHLSSLIHSGSGNMTREKALEELTTPPCEPELMKADKEFVIKKLGFTDIEFEQIMAAAPKTYRDYPNGRWYITRLKNLQHFLRKVGLQYR